MTATNYAELVGRLQTVWKLDPIDDGIDPFCREQMLEAADAILALQREVERKDKALVYALTEGARWSEICQCYSDSGCGCCSGTIDAPPEIKAVWDAAIGEGK